MKIAMPIDEEKKVNAHFGHSRFFAIVDLDKESKQVNSIEVLSPGMFGHGALPGWLVSQGVSVLLVNGIGPGAINGLKANDIEVVAGVPAINHLEVIEGWLNNTLRLQATTCQGHGSEEHHCHEHQHGSEGEHCGHHHGA